MTEYIDGFVIPVPTKHLALYRRMARTASKVWRELGAIDYRECVGDDMKVKEMTPFPKAANAKAGESVVFAWITYKSRAHRDKVNAKVMQDPRIRKMMAKDCPFDSKRMVYGGFKTIVT
jgi:uncharacterized protein YbaA (DUF1428 family)